MEELAGKVAVVTGAASGIGRALAERFVEEGMRVVLADVEAGPLHAAAASLSESGDVFALRTDVADPRAVDDLRDAALDRYGVVNVVCNNAGVAGGGPLAEVPLETCQWVLGVDLWGVVHGIRSFVPHLLAHGDGHVVNTASVAGLVPFPGLGPYTVAKYGVMALSETLHQELLEAGSTVGVTALCPGFVATRILDSERNRPESLLARQPPPTEEEERMVEVARELYAATMPPAQVAAAVVDAIRRRRLYCFTDAAFADLIAARAQAVATGSDLPRVGTLLERLAR